MKKRSISVRRHKRHNKSGGTSIIRKHTRRILNSKSGIKPRFETGFEGEKFAFSREELVGQREAMKRGEISRADIIIPAILNDPIVEEKLEWFGIESTPLSERDQQILKNILLEEYDIEPSEKTTQLKAPVDIDHKWTQELTLTLASLDDQDRNRFLITMSDDELLYYAQMTILSKSVSSLPKERLTKDELITIINNDTDRLLLKVIERKKELGLIDSF